MKISQNQATILVIAQGVAMFIVLAGFIATESGRDGWLSILLAFIIGALVTPIIIYIAKQFPSKTIIAYLPDVWGKVVGKIFGFLIILNLLILAAIFFRGTTGNIKAMYITTPQIILSGLSAIMVGYAIKQGLEVLTRTSSFLLILLLISVVFTLLALLPDIKLSHIFPFLENGFTPVIKGMPIILGVMVNLLVFIGFIYPGIKKPEKPNLKFGGAILFAGIFQSIIAIFYLGFYGLRIVQNNVIHPYYNMLRYVELGEIISGFESLFVIVWLASTFFLLTGYLYPVIGGIADIFSLKSYKPIVAPLLAIAVGLSVLIPSPLLNIRLYFIVNLYGSTSIGVIILLTFFMVLIKKKRGTLKTVKSTTKEQIK